MKTIDTVSYGTHAAKVKESALCSKFTYAQDSFERSFDSYLCADYRLRQENVGRNEEDACNFQAGLVLWDRKDGGT